MSTTRWLKIGGLAIGALLLLWIVLELVGLVLGFLSWLVGVLVSLLVVGLLLGLGYLAVTWLLGKRSSSTARSSERERIFE